jgi:copper transport protein
VGGIAAALALVPQAASAHAELLQSDPPPGAVLATAPSEVTLVFSEPVTPAGAGIKVFSPSGVQVAARVASDGAVLKAVLGATEAGTYIVSWQVFAADTHPSRGVYSFSIGQTSSNPFSALLDAGSAGTATPLGLALQMIARWVHFAGFALVFGIVAYSAAIRRHERFRRLVVAGVALLIAAEPLGLLAQLASLSIDGDTALAVLGSGFGRLVGLRLGAALLAWTFLALPRAWPMLVLGAVDAVLDGAGAHAIPGWPAVGQAVVAVHVAGMGLWVGGVAGFLQAPDRRFARYAAATFGVAAATGLALALVHTDLGAALLGTDYGRAVILKAVIVGAAITAAGLGRRRMELVLAAAVVGAAALVAALPPPL